MDSKELGLFREAYGSVYTPQTEDIQEVKTQQKIEDSAKEISNAAKAKKLEDSKPTLQTSSADLFDIVKGHLMSEGYADTEEAALAIMAHMSEEWRTEIVEGSCMGGGKKKKKKSGYW